MVRQTRSTNYINMINSADASGQTEEPSIPLLNNNDSLLNTGYRPTDQEGICSGLPSMKLIYTQPQLYKLLACRP